MRDFNRISQFYNLHKMGNAVTYRVKGIKPHTWSLKTKFAFGKKNIQGHFIDKEIGYFPGKSSTFVEDNPQVKPTDVPTFEYNDATGFTELKVNSSNQALINYLETHLWFNSKFEKFDPEQESMRQLSIMENTEKALELLKGKTGDEVTAIGLLVIGTHAVNMGEINVLSELKQIAFKQPERILKVIENFDFKTVLIGALAFVKGIVQTNDTKTAILWKDNKGLIVRVAKGEDPIEKLSEFLVKEDDESVTTLQELGLRIGQSFTEVDVVDDKDAEIATLRAKLEAFQNPSNSDLIQNDKNESLVNTSEDTLESLHQAFFDKMGKEVPVNKKNNIDWIKNQLAE